MLSFFKKHSHQLLFFVFGLIFIDQFFKIYIKTHFIIGEEINVAGTWFKLHFIENPGMAYGFKFSDGRWAKIALSILRLLAIMGVIFYAIKKIIPKNNKVFNYLLTLIIAGAVGNLLDSLFYGLIFTESQSVLSINPQPAIFSMANNYGAFLEGKVVDMLYFPVIRTVLPNWIPIWGGQYYEFFSPIFNIADFCISGGIITIIVFNKKIFKHQKFNELIK